MAREHRLRSRFELVGLTQEIRPRAAALLGGVARQLDAVDGEHLASDQPLTITDREHLGEDLRNLVTERTNETGDRGEVRLAVAGEGDEDGMLAAQAFNAATADDTLRVGEQHELEQRRRRIGRRAGSIIAEACIERGQVDLVFEQVIERMLEGAGQQLALQIERDETG